MQTKNAPSKDIKEKSAGPAQRLIVHPFLLHPMPGIRE
jgi:hypothetical protein